MSKKTIERAERAEKERVKKARKVQDKADKNGRAALGFPKRMKPSRK
jgi:hypothetical protein